MGNEISIERISAELDSDRAIWAAVAELCCRTGNDGDPISTERWELFGRIWIEPYRVLIPQWSYVALADRRVVGYLTGCPDTLRFYRQRFVRCALPLLRQIVFGRYHGDPTASASPARHCGWRPVLSGALPNASGAGCYGNSQRTCI
jgi:hypothetical protein